MTKREKTLGLNFLAVVIVIAHLWGFNKWQKQKLAQQDKVDSLNAKLESFELMDQSAIAFVDDVEWLNDNAAPVTSFQDAQTELQNFLVSTSEDIGFSPYKQNLISKSDVEVDGSSVDDTHFQRVKIQISARATEEQIYKWLVEIHQPQKMRIVSYLKLTPPENESQEIKCDIIAEQFISNQ